MKAIFIDSGKREVRLVDYQSYRDISDMVGGLITTAGHFPNGDTLFVDDEGLLKFQLSFFRIDSIRTDGQPLAGNGVILGEDDPDDDGTNDPKTKVEDLVPLITWMDRAEVRAWAEANASRPAVTVTSLDADGPVTEVITTYGDLMGQIDT